jgi:hypothetical protein
MKENRSMKLDQMKVIQYGMLYVSINSHVQILCVY